MKVSHFKPTLDYTIDLIEKKAQEWVGAFPYRFYFLTTGGLFQFILTTDQTVENGTVKLKECPGTIVKTENNTLDKLNIPFWLNQCYDPNTETEDKQRVLINYTLTFRPTSTVIFHRDDYKKAKKLADEIQRKTQKHKKSFVEPLFNNGFWELVKHGRMLAGANPSICKPQGWKIYEGIVNTSPLELTAIANELEGKGLPINLSFCIEKTKVGYKVLKSEHAEPLSSFVAICWKSAV